MSHAALGSVRLGGWCSNNRSSGSSLPNVESKVTGPSASREDRTVRRDGWRKLVSGVGGLHHLATRLENLGLELEVGAVVPHAERVRGQLARDRDLGLVESTFFARQ